MLGSLLTAGRSPVSLWTAIGSGTPRSVCTLIGTVSQKARTSW